MHSDKAFEHYCPCRISETILQRSKDLRDTVFAGMGGYENVLDILRLWGSSLVDEMD
jgi:hypothetical protein